MKENSVTFIGLDTSKLKISVAVADGERNGEVRFFGDISSRSSLSSIGLAGCIPSGACQNDAEGRETRPPTTSLRRSGNSSLLPMTA